MAPPKIVSFLGAVLCFSFLLWPNAVAVAQMTDVLTYHNDNGRTGQALNEKVLTPSNVNSGQFGKVWTLPTDGKVFAEPLYAAGISIPGAGTRNVVFVATEHDSVYAFDADSTNVLWHVQALGAGEIPYQTSSCTITPEIGITATPVIDRQLGPNGTIFVQAMSQNSSNICFQRLYAFDLATGQQTVPSAVITGSYPGTGDDSTNGVDQFIPAHYVERACLLLVNGVVYTAWSGHCNVRPYTCWVIGYDEHTLAQANIINLEPNSYNGSIWNSGGGPAADGTGNIYVTPGNGAAQDFTGPLDANGFPADKDYGTSMIKLAFTNNSLVVTDYFAMYNIISEDLPDLDLGAGCAVVLPDQIDTQGHAHQLVSAAGKDQNLYIADRSNMGKYSSVDNRALYQELTNVFADANNDAPNEYGETGGIWSVGAYFNHTLYYGPVNGQVTAFPFINARLGPISSQSSSRYGYPGATPSISANGVSNGIVWTVEILGAGGFPDGGTAAVLHAYAPSNLAQEYYNSSQASSNRDQVVTGQRFTLAMIASGRVYIATTNSIAVFGLLDQSSLTPIQQWRNNYFGNPSNVGAGANSATPAKDGVPNLVKYALGLNPLVPQISPTVFPSVQQMNGQSYLTVTVNRNANPPDVTNTVEVSSDLQNWNTSSNITTLTNSNTQFIFNDNRPLGSYPNEYLRLRFLPVSDL